MLQSHQKMQCLLSLILFLVGFGIALTMIVLDTSIAARIAGLIIAFCSGWGCCYSLGFMSGGITEQKSLKQGVN